MNTPAETAAQARVVETPEKALELLKEIYSQQTTFLHERFQEYAKGETTPKERVHAYYPYVEIEVGNDDEFFDNTQSYGFVDGPGVYRATITDPTLFGSYIVEQLTKIKDNHPTATIRVGITDETIPAYYAKVQSGDKVEFKKKNLDHFAGRYFDVPDLIRAPTDRSIVDANNGLFDEVRPLSLFHGEETDYSLQRIIHYTGTRPECFQDFIIFTNYPHYMDRFLAAGHEILDDKIPKTGFASTKKDRHGFIALVDPHSDKVHLNPNNPDAAEIFNRVAPNTPLKAKPNPKQMPAYHLMRADGSGISIVNIGVGPSNAKNITDHLAVLRPHAWIMLGHCGGLSRNHEMGSYVLANAYARNDKVLDEEVPLSTPIPPLAEIQDALFKGVEQAQRLRKKDMTDDELRNIMKTTVQAGTVWTDVDRNWELRRGTKIYQHAANARAQAVDMESATIATNGYRYRVPYGSLLCVSDKPLHGEPKMPGAAQAFYDAQIDNHFWAGMFAMRELAVQESRDHLHSRKLRSFEEPAFR